LVTVPQPEGALLACDPGDVRIGIAVSDQRGTLALPRDAIKAGDGAIEEVIAMAEELDAVEIIVGLPLSLDGSAGPAAQRVLAWTDELRARTSIPVQAIDERLTTVEAQRRLKTLGRSERQSRNIIDSQAAAVLLEYYLEQRRGGSIE